MRRHFPVREKSGNFEQTGKVRENQGKSHKILEKHRGISEKYYVIFWGYLNELYYLLKWIKFSVKKQNIKKYWKNGKKILYK